MDIKDLKGAVLASSVYLDGEQSAVNATITLPEVTPATVEVTAAGGTIELPVFTKLEAMEATLAVNGVNGGILKKLTPERHRLTCNIVQQSVGADASKAEHVKASLEVVPKTIPAIEATYGEAAEQEITFSVLSYKLSIAGKVVLKIDPVKGIYKVNGKDYSKEITAMI
jgi:P2 family phage contractile tail tube protein